MIFKGKIYSITFAKQEFLTLKDLKMLVKGERNSYGYGKAKLL